VSTLDEKLTPPPTPTHGNARQKWGSLQAASGHLEVVEGTEQEPRKVLRASMDRLQVWRWVSGRGREAWFELERES
jgi:hypothetical protein